EPIDRRLDGVEWLLSSPVERRRLRDLLGECRDVERAAARLSMNAGNPRDLGAIRDTLRLLPGLMPLVSSSPLEVWTGSLPDFSALDGELASALEEELPRLRTGGHIIRAGYDRELDEWRDSEAGASSWLDAYLERIREETGIPRIKAGYNKVFGYYLEVGKAAAAGMPEGFIRKQTLVNAERFITGEMKAFEERMETAVAEISRREEELYRRLVDLTLDRVGDLQLLGQTLAALDVLASLAEAAREMGYTRPEVNDGFDLEVEGGRHPVVEKVITDEPFVPNSLVLEREGKRIALITGPNMAGKSTYLRTSALLTIMAQMGSFVPAEKAEIGLCDRIFTRIGARDDLARGSSTFMVEMLETANILHNVTDRSLVILDEVGRGTSTYDGMSIAWAVLEYLAGECGVSPRVLFATHYHELTALEDRFPCIENLTMAVKEEEGRVFFLHQVAKGSADRSYGIEVARLAGLPRPVLRRAFELLQRFEKEESPVHIKEEEKPPAGVRQLTLFDAGSRAVVEELASLEPDSLTPFRALELLYKLRDKSREVVCPEDNASS
ncbi:MAG: DNA mismatch repair protein MutS, partial [Aminivibrio sp.]